MRRDGAPLDMRAMPKAPHHPVAKSFAVKTCLKKDRYCWMVHKIVAETVL